MLDFSRIQHTQLFLSLAGRGISHTPIYYQQSMAENHLPRSSCLVPALRKPPDGLLSSFGGSDGLRPFGCFVAGVRTTFRAVRCRRGNSAFNERLR